MMELLLAAGPAGGDTNVPAAISVLFLLLLARPRLWSRKRDDVTPGRASIHVHAISDHSPAVFALLDDDGRVVSLSPNAHEWLGPPAERAIEMGHSLSELLCIPRPEDEAGLLAAVQRALPGQARRYVVACRRQDGADGAWEVWFKNLHDDPDVCGTLVEVRDATDQVSDADRLTLLDEIVERAADSIMVTDAHGTIVYVNRECERRTGHAADALLGQTPDVLRSGRHRPAYFTRMWETISAGRVFRGELTNRRADGTLYDEEIIITPVRGEDGTVHRFVSVARDVSDRRRLETEVAEKAFFDPVTGLPNMRLLRERARQILALARRRGHLAALLHVDIDRLRQVNEARGRAVGDELLRAVGRRLEESLRESDTLARAGSDEFVVLLSEVSDEDAAARVVRRLRETLSRPYQLGGDALDLKVHAGVALYPQDATTFDELLEDASVALERARAADSGFEFFRREQSALSHDRLNLEDDLRWAWEHDQFVLHYQPILAAGSGKVVGAEALTRGNVVGMEALARWPHLERGMMSPADFIPLAERTGRIVSLDRWAIATAARQAASWARGGWDGWVSVNLSARSLHDPDLADYVGRTLRNHGLARERVVLEITESTAMRDPEVTAQVLRRLREAGALVAVDDFGIGHSSLAYLKHFPVDLLKLDRSFVAEVGTGTRDEELVGLIIDLAHRIGAQVVAEGVEREEQYDWLREAGCDYIQGFLVGRPGPPDQVPGSDH
ncbi:MAG: EAL domain-containing protein [Gemmatimonadota bacterium]